jgi:hypothetical protein
MDNNKLSISAAGRNQILKEKMKKVEDQARADAETGRIYRIYASDGNPLDTGTYLFVAEFARRKPAEKYADYIQKKKRYSDKAIVVKEIIAEEPAPEEGEIVLLLSPLGEFPVPKEESSKTDKPQPMREHKQKKTAKEKAKRNVQREKDQFVGGKHGQHRL